MKTQTVNLDITQRWILTNKLDKGSGLFISNKSDDSKIMDKVLEQSFGNQATLVSVIK